MNKKIIPLASIIIITIIAGVFFYDTSNLDKELLKKTFNLNAVYYENEEIIEITFRDESQKTNFVILEILGMKESFQKTFTDSSFSEKISFTVPPKYGWEIHPIVLVVEHEDYGEIEMKTEIHNVGEPPKPIIFSRR